MHKGDHALNFVVYDNDEALKLSMPSRKQKVKISQELLDELESHEVYYKLN
jgi:DNA polymerase-3 subunit alpha